jgi:acetyl esterase/lipase
VAGVITAEPARYGAVRPLNSPDMQQPTGGAVPTISSVGDGQRLRRSRQGFASHVGDLGGQVVEEYLGLAAAEHVAFGANSFGYVMGGGEEQEGAT